MRFIVLPFTYILHIFFRMLKFTLPVDFGVFEFTPIVAPIGEYQQTVFAMGLPMHEISTKVRLIIK